MKKSIYIHIPFCKNICSYCDFCKMFYNEKLVDNYLIALEKEMTDNYQGEIIETIYIGGGTPSCLTIEQLQRLLEMIKKINVSGNLEYTIEINPEDITDEKLALMREYGINRVSIGLETIDKNNMKLINRNNDNFKEKISIVKKYISNINIDLMYGFNQETIKILDKDLDFILSLDINHISTYSLIIEEHTKLYINKYKRLDDDNDFKLYDRIINRLENKGFKHYEISNFSKEGYQSKHNLTYWHNEEYYGFGLGASGYINNLRYTNTKNINKYINNNLNRTAEELSIEDKKVYHMILGLRLIEGVNLAQYEKLYNSKIEDDFNIKELLDKKYLIKDNGYLKINPKYIYQENSILLNFVD